MFGLFKPKMKYRYEVPGATIMTHIKNQPSSDVIIATMMQLGATSEVLTKSSIYINSLDEMREAVESEEELESDTGNITVSFNETIFATSNPDISEEVLAQREDLKEETIEYVNRVITPCVTKKVVYIYIHNIDDFNVATINVVFEDAKRVAEYYAKKEIKKHS